MYLTPEQQDLGRRNFLRALAGTPALAALGTAAALKGRVGGGPVRLGYIGLGGQGRVLLDHTDPRFGEVVALCDINPAQLRLADEELAKKGRAGVPHYAEWREMLEKELIEGVVIAAPLWMHADIAVGCLEAGKHVLCEKMMAWDEDGCRRMAEAARQTGRGLEIGYHRCYNPVYHPARLVWPRNGNGRRQGEPPSPDYDPSRWGYPSFEHLLNWRLYRRYSKGLLAELGSHQVGVTDWFFGGVPEAVSGTGGVFRFKDGREVPDHVYVIFEYPQGRTVVFTSIESNAFDHYYEALFGTKATLILRGETEAYLFDETTKGAPRPTGIDVTPRTGGPVVDASESRTVDAAGASGFGSSQRLTERVQAYRAEVAGFCGYVRTGAPLKCGVEQARLSARARLRAQEAIDRDRKR